MTAAPCLRLVLYQPDIPQNTGALLRLGACLGVPVDVVEPAGFALGDRALRRAGMDYAARAVLTRHPDWAAWQGSAAGRRVLLTTRGDLRLDAFRFAPGDCLILGRESAGAPDFLHATADARVRIPLAAGNRSLNVALAAAIALGEALRQTGGWPAGEDMHMPADDPSP